jgi:mono/diheme cytochrome c family protein
VIVVAAIVIVLMRFDLTALQEPGRFETSVSNHARRFLVHRASRHGTPRPALSTNDMKASIASGSTLYGLECGMCHGADGRGQTQFGSWMYPRAADLTSPDVQNYSDQELFWVVQNGIRFTGMPAFGKVETEEHIWNLVDYVRTLPQSSEQKSK